MAENTNITWNGIPIDELHRDALSLQKINENGTVEEMIDTINSNFLEIARHGGGPAGLDGNDGFDGVDGINNEYIYALCDSIEPNDGGSKFPNDYSGKEDLFNRVSANGSASYMGNVVWFDHPSGVSPDHRNEYVFSRYRRNESSAWSYADYPVVWSHWGEKGMDGDGVEYIFMLSTEELTSDNEKASKIFKLSALNAEQKVVYNIDDFYPGAGWFTTANGEKAWKALKGAGYNYDMATFTTLFKSPNFFGFPSVDNNWTDDPIGTSANYMYEYVSIRRSNTDEMGKKEWSEYSVPALWSSYSKTSRTFIVYKNTDSREPAPPRPSGGSWLNGVFVAPSGWFDKNIEEDGKYTWMSSGIFDAAGNLIDEWSDPICITGADGKNGADGNNETFIYSLSDEEPAAPIYGTYDEKMAFFTAVETADPQEWTENPQGYEYIDPVTSRRSVWYDNPQGIEPVDGKRTEWVWSKSLPANATSTTRWQFIPRPIVWAHWGEDGTDGDGVEYIFFRSTVKESNGNLPDRFKPAKISTLNTVQKVIYNIDDFYPGPGWFTTAPVNNKQKAIDALTAANLYNSLTFETEWSNRFGFNLIGGGTEPCWTDNPEGASLAYPFEWVSIRKSHPDGQGNRTWDDFGEPSIWTTYNMKTRIFIVYCCVNEGEPPAKPTGGWWDGSDDGGLRTREPGHELSEPWTDYDESRPGKISYLSSGLFAENGNNIYWSNPFRMTGEKGKPGADGSNIEFVYCLSEEEPQFPAYTGSQSSYEITMDFFDKVENAISDSDPEHDGYVYRANNKSTEWFDHPQGIANEDGKRKEWVWSRSLPANEETWTFPEKPVIWAHWGEDGTDGDGVEYIFSLGKNPSYTLTENDWNSIWNSFNTDTARAVYSMDDFIPNEEWFTTEHYNEVSTVMTENGKSISSQDWESIRNEIVTSLGNLARWTDNPSSVTAENQYQFVSIRKFVNGAWQNFSYPQVWANYSFRQYDAFAFVAVPAGVDLTNYQPSGGNFESPVPDDDSTTIQGVTLDWTDGPEPTSKFDEIWMTNGRVSERTPNSIIWSKPKKMADSNDFQVEWSQDDMSITELNSINAALAGTIQGGVNYEGNTYTTYDFGEYLTKNNNNENAAEAAWRHVVHTKLGVEFSDNSSQSILMATCQLKNGNWTHWVINRVKGETGEAGRSLNVTGRITYEVYLDNNTYTKSAAQTKMNSSLPSNPQLGERLIVYPKDPTGEIYIGDTTAGLGGALYMWKYDGSSWVDINDPATNGELPNNTYTSPNGHLILWDGDTWQDVGDIVGPAGPMNKIIIAFANDDPNDSSKKVRVTGDDIPTAKWIGFLVYNENDENNQPLNNINAPEWVWSLFKGQDGYGYEFIYKSTSEKSAPSVPYNASWVNQANVIPTSDGWVDDPIEPDDSTNRYVWMCWRKYDYGTQTWTHFAGKNGKTGNQSGAVARLWQMYVNSIEEVSEYFHADSSSSPNFPLGGDIPAGSDLPSNFFDFWHAKSDVIGSSATTYKWNKTNRHLFNVEVITYSDGSMKVMEPHYISSYADGIVDIIDYYILDTDGGSAPRMNGNVPYTSSTSGNTVEGKGYWTTNVKKTPISADYPYLWNISKKTYEDNPSGVWSDPMVVAVWGAGEGAVYLDMDNEMDVIQIDSSRKALETKTFESTIHMYDGSDIIKISRVQINNEENLSGFKLFKRETEDSSWVRVNNPSDVSFSPVVSSLKMELSINKGDVIPSEYTKIQFTVTSDDSDIRMVSYTLTGTTNPSIYHLKLSSNVIVKTGNNVFDPNPLIITVIKSTGGSTIEYEGDQTGEGGFKLLLNDVSFPTYTVTNQYLVNNNYDIGSKLVFKLHVDTNDSDTALDTIMDMETVYIIGKGEGYDDDWLKKLLDGNTDISGALVMTGDLLARNHNGQITAGVMGHDYNNSDISSNIRFFAGNTQISNLTDSTAASFISAVKNSPFRVTEGGKLYATDAVVSGAITATQLTIAGSTLSNSTDVSNWINSFVDIPEGSGDGDDYSWITRAFSSTNISGGLIQTGNLLAKDSNNKITAGVMGYNTSATNDIRFFAGTTVSASATGTSIISAAQSAPFRVDESGNMYATKGQIAGMTVSASGLQLGDNIFIGNDTEYGDCIKISDYDGNVNVLNANGLKIGGSFAAKTAFVVCDLMDLNNTDEMNTLKKQYGIVSSNDITTAFMNYDIIAPISCGNLTIPSYQYFIGRKITIICGHPLLADIETIVSNSGLSYSINMGVHSSNCIFKFANEGICKFYENGGTSNTLKLQNEAVDIIGLGLGADFKGFLVSKRYDITTEYEYGQHCKCLGMYNMTGTTVNNYMSYNGTGPLSVTSSTSSSTNDTVTIVTPYVISSSQLPYIVVSVVPSGGLYYYQIQTSLDSTTSTLKIVIKSNTSISSQPYKVMVFNFGDFSSLSLDSKMPGLINKYEYRFGTSGNWYTLYGDLTFNYNDTARTYLRLTVSPNVKKVDVVLDNWGSAQSFYYYNNSGTPLQPGTSVSYTTSSTTVTIGSACPKRQNNDDTNNIARLSITLHTSSITGDVADVKKTYTLILDQSGVPDTNPTN